MKRSAWMLLAVLAACAQSAAAASPALIAQTYYVAPYGYDGSDGLSAATAFGSVTRAAAVIGTAPQDGYHYILLIAPGEYRTNQVLFMNLTAPVDVIGDTLGAAFGVPGGSIWLNAGSTAPTVVTLYNVRGFTLTAVGLFKLGLASATNDRVIEVYGSSGVALKGLNVSSPSATPASYGILLGADSSSVVVEGATVSSTGEGVSISGTPSVTVSNCWIYRNATGLGIGHPAKVAAVNNLITLNTGFGVQLAGACPGTVLLNNIICNNGDTLSGGQITADYSPLANAGNGTAAWRSTFNLIGGGTQQFGELVSGMTSTLIPNQKVWMQLTGQDAWGASHDGQVFSSPGSPVPINVYEMGGFGAAHFSGVTAPAADYFGQVRPQALVDYGCVEINETLSAFFHHIGLQAPAAAALPRHAVPVSVTLYDSSNGVMTGTVGLTFYAYLQGGPNLTDVDPLGRITSVDATVQADGVVPGLYRVTGAVPTTFTLQVVRDSDASSATPYQLRVVEWPDWHSTATGTHGGKAAALNTLRWLVLPDAARSQVTAESPVVASGRDGAAITLRVRDAAGQPISGLLPADFTFTFTGIGALTAVSEIPGQPGDYGLCLVSTEIGIKTVRATVLGVVLADQPQVAFVAGVFGDVRALATGDLLTGIHLTLTAANGVLAGAADSAAGTYSIPVPAPAADPYILTAAEPAGLYPRTAFTVRLSADQAVRQDVLLGTTAAASLAGYAFPNPAPRGSQVTLVCDLPRAGKLRLDLFDLRGRRVGTLINADLPAGRTQTLWRAANRFGETLAPGVYLLHYQFGGDKTTAKLVITP